MSLAQNAYIDASNAYENSLDSAFKKDNGVYYTDLSLAEKMLRELHADKSSVVLDPCCGTGVFVYAALMHGFENVYGIDQDKSAIAFCQNSIHGAVFATSDSIGNDANATLSLIDLDSRPDIILGNPPYVPLTSDAVFQSDCSFKHRVSDSGNNLFVAALMRALDLVKPDGVVSYIIPKNFLHVHSYSIFRRELLEKKTIVSIVDLGAYFKHVRGEQIVITIKNSRERGLSKITAADGH